MLNLIKNLGKWSLNAIDQSIDKAPVTPEEKIRLRHFAVFVVWGVATMLPFTLYHFVTGNLLIGSLVFFTGSSLVFGWVLMCYLPLGQMVYRCNAFVFAGLLLYMLVLGGEDNARGLWIFTFPLAIFFLIGKKEGLIWSLGLLAVGLFLLYFPPTGVQPHYYSNAFIIRLGTVYLFITSVTFWFEFYRDHFRRELNKEHQKNQQMASDTKQDTKISLHLAHQQLLTILESIDAHVYVIDVATYEILYMNQAMKEVFGDNLEGQLCYQAFRATSAPCGHCPLPQLLGGNGDAKEKSAWECYNPVSKRWYSNVDRLITWPDQRRVKVQIAFDITTSKQWEAEREAAEKAFYQSQNAEALQRMAGAISNHFNNQLTTIIGNLQLALESSRDDESVRGYLQSAIQVAIDSSEMSMLLSQYTGQLSSALQPIDVGKFCQQHKPTLEKLLPANILLKTDHIAPDLLIQVDTITLEQILVQLVSNGREAINGRGGRIHLSTTLTEARDIEIRQCEPNNWQPLASSYCCLAVSDTGCGVSEDNKDRIFDPFFTTKLSSRGLGLAIVLGIVKASGGAVTVTSDVQRGCIVKVFLPLIDNNTMETTS